jgi:MFS family permease
VKDNAAPTGHSGGGAPNGPAAGAAAAIDPRLLRRLAVGLVLGVTTFAFDQLSVTAAMPAVVRDIGGISLYGATFSAFVLAQLCSTAVGGPIADRYGPRPVLAFGLASFAVGLVVGGAAPVMTVVLAGRAIQGLGAGAIGATAYVVIGRAFPAEQRPRLFAVLSAAWVVPGLLAPAVAGFVADHLTWRLVFLGLLPFPAIAAALALPPLRRLGPASPERAGDGVVARQARLALTLALGVGVLLVALDRRSVPLAVAGALAGVAVMARPASRLLPAGTIRARPVLPAIVATRIAAHWALFGVDAFVPFALTQARGRTTFQAGLVLTVGSVSWAAAASVQARLTATVPDRTLARRGALTMAAGVVVTAVGSAWSAVPVIVIFAGPLLYGFGMGLLFSTTSVAALAEAVPGEEGNVSSALQLGDALGIALATGLGGAVVALGARSGWQPAATVAVVFAVTGAAVVPTVLAAGRLRAEPGTRPGPAEPTRPILGSAL